MTKTGLANIKLEHEKEMQAREHLHDKREKDRQRKFTAEENAKQRTHETKRGRAANWTKVGVQGMKMAGDAISALASKNDPAWYSKYIKNLWEFTNVPTYERVGSNVYKGLFTNSKTRPGIMAIWYYNTIGTQDNTNPASNPINQILMRSKEMVLKLNSRSNVSWEPGDLGFNIFVSGSILSLLGECKRVLEVYKTYRGDNAFLAETLIKVLGFGYSDLVNNFAEYRKRYAILVERFNKAIVAPRSLSYYARKWFLATNLFIDHGSSDHVPQIYAYCGHNEFYLNSSGTGVTSTKYAGPTSSNTVGNVLDLVASQIQSITENADFVEMYADLRAAFGDNLIQLNPELADEIAFNDDVMNRLQIHNLKSLPIVMDTHGNMGAFDGGTWLNIQQDSSGWIYQGGRSDYYTFPYTSDTTGFTSGGSLTTAGQNCRTAIKGRYGLGYLCDSDNDNVSGEEILDITRLQPIVSELGSDFSIQVTGCGTEIVTQFIVTARTPSNNTTDSQVLGTFVYDDATSVARVLRFMTGRSYLADFDWMPESTARMVADGVNYVQFDMYHAYTIDNDTLIQIHEACVLSEFYIEDTSFTGSGR